MAVRILDKIDKLLIIKDQDNQTFYSKVDADGVALKARGEGGVLKIYRGDNEELENLGPATDIDDPVTEDLEDMVEAVQLLIDNVVMGGNARIDAQTASSSSVDTTASTGYVDMPNMTLTTKDLGENGHYFILFDGNVENTNINETISVIINVDGADDPDSERTVEMSSANALHNIGTQSGVTSLDSSKIIKVRWKTSGNTATVVNRTLHILGDPTSNVVS